mgnify:FL=1
MAAKLADAVAYLKTDDKELRQGISGAEKTVEGMGGKFSSVLTGIGVSVGMGIAGIATAAVGQVVNFMGESIGAASDLGETLSKTNVLFGESSDAVVKFAENAAIQFGQSQQQALDAAATFATFGKAAGLAGNDLVDFSTGFVGLASDLASFNNTTPEQAIDAIGAALRGESEPLRAYGVLLDDATLRQEAMALGIYDGNGALTAQQKVLAAQAAIYKQTGDAQGDFGRTSDGLANQQRILDAQMENLKTTMGQALLPIVLAVVSAFNGLVQQALPPLQAFMQEKVIPVMEALGAVMSASVGPVLQAAMGWFQGLGEAVDKQTSGPLNFFNAWIAQNMPRIQQIVETVLGAITAFWEEHGAAIVAAVQRYFGWIMQFWEMMFRTLLNIVQVFLQVLTGDWEGAGQTLQNIVRDWQTTLTSIFRQVVQAIVDVWTSIDWGGIGRGILEGIGAGMSGAAGWLADQARQAAWNALDAAKGALGINSPSSVAADEVGRPFVEGIGEGMRRAMDGLTAGANALAGGMVGAAGAGATAGAPIAITINISGGGDASGVGLASRDGVLAALRAAGVR